MTTTKENRLDILKLATDVVLRQEAATLTLLPEPVKKEDRAALILEVAKVFLNFVEEKL